MDRRGSGTSELVLPGSPRMGWAGVGEWWRSIWRGAPIFSLCVLTVAVVCAIFAPLLAPADPIQTDRTKVLSPPSFSRHLLGTDHLGRDILSRLIYGARISVTVGFLAVVVSGAVGTLIALVSGVLRGWVDAVLMRITDAFLALPYLVVAVTVVAILGSSLLNVILVIGLLRWMTYARTIRGEVLRLTEMDFVRLARVAGVSRCRIMARHIFPNVVNTLLVLGTLEVGSAVITEASLSFLGLGIPRPLPSWGAMLAESQTYVFAAWWLPVFPGLAITLLVMASNLTGDWLRDRFDPTRRQL
jgi:peptide/nickel transport system permease protein